MQPFTRGNARAYFGVALNTLKSSGTRSHLVTTYTIGCAT